ncbi:hypothetical protein DR871_003865 [Flavobacterium petrolei]|uniref:Uncharacterized protein n=1 Tax=Flavobacterium petrolei TaxID=2259594 RepID=A0A482TNI3_9FLAO|nr:hypothetical protein [Flavobacterium petrolei]RYJ53193.1 hypothetical protein DR871_003865 [Flavobacterium petrolei]
MSTTNILKVSKNFPYKVEDAILKIFNILNLKTENESNFVSPEIYRIMDNPVDKENFNNAVEFLQKHRDIKNKEILLSDNKHVVISIE